MTSLQPSFASVVAETGGGPTRSELLWEAAYAQFETPEEEIRKFTRRLLRMGAAEWPRNAGIVELFCGRGNGLHALSGLGFTRLEGVDLSPRLAAQYTGRAKCYVSDCRQLPFGDASRDILIVQGGLHHLLALPSDLEHALAEAWRVLKPDGILMAVEPWLTPFLSVVHAAGRNSLARRLSGKLDALATMIEHERATYEQWLRQPDLILGQFAKHFEAKRLEMRFGKLWYVGRRRRVG